VEFCLNSVCLFSLFICTNDVYLATKHGHSPLPTHHQPRSSPPPPFVTAHNGLNNTSSPSPIAATHIRRPRPQLPQQEQCGSATSPSERAPAASMRPTRGGFQLPRRRERRVNQRRTTTMLLFVVLVYIINEGEDLIHLRPRSR
jgi:hypothetical protein